MTIWNSINATIHPEMKEKLLSGELYHWECEVCGLKTDVLFDTIYHDMEHRFMLFFSPCDDERQAKLESVEMSVMELAGAKDYTCRMVYGMNRMREKIAILEHGLNDIAVERMKFFLRLDASNHLSKDDGLFFFDVDTDPEKIKSTDWKRGAIRFVVVKAGTEPSLLVRPMEIYYDYLLAVDMDSRMKCGQLACIDEIWMKQQLSRM